MPGRIGDSIFFDSTSDLRAFMDCGPGYEGTESLLTEVLARHITKRWLVEVRSLRFGETLSYRYRIPLKTPDSYGPLLKDLSDVEGVERIVLEPEDEGMGISEA